MPVIDTNQRQLATSYISDATIDSLAFSILDTNYDFWIQSSDVPDASPFKLDTTSLSLFFPGLSTKYGVNVPCALKINVVGMSNF